jgi:hypothetical protein
MKISNLYLKKSRAIIIMAVFVILAGNAMAQFKLYSTGSLSIGSITPPPAGSELQVIGNTVFSNAAGIIKSSALIKGLNIFSTDTNPDYTWCGNNLSGIFHPGLNIIAFTIAGNETMRLSPGNNLLIGTKTDNGDKLQVAGNSNGNSFDIFSTTTTNNVYSGINWVDNATTKAWALQYSGQDKFYVLGNGQAYSYGWNILSDSTLKENISNIQGALNKVLQLQGVTYNFKKRVYALSDGSESPRQMGLLAQAVERVVPEVVSTTSTGLKTIAYSNLVGLLIEAMKQEDKRVTILQHKLDSCFTVSAGEIENTNEQARLYQCNVGSVNQKNSIQCYVPAKSGSASLLLFDMNGALKKTISVNGKEDQFVTLQQGELGAGMYYYTLVIDGKEIDTKKIIISL